MKKIFLVLTLLVSGFGFSETYIACRMDAKTFDKDNQRYLERFPPSFFNLFVVVYGDYKLGAVAVQMDKFLGEDSDQFNIGRESEAFTGRLYENSLFFDGRRIDRKTLAYTRHLSKQKGQCELLDESSFFNQRKKTLDVATEGNLF